MPDQLVLPPPKGSRSQRQRKKLCIGECHVLGFYLSRSRRAAPSIEVQVRFIGQLLVALIEARALSLGDWINLGFAAASSVSVTVADRSAFVSCRGQRPAPS